jgi:hypothetical protein
MNGAATSPSSAPVNLKSKNTGATITALGLDAYVLHLLVLKAKSQKIHNLK